MCFSSSAAATTAALSQATTPPQEVEVRIPGLCVCIVRVRVSEYVVGEHAQQSAAALRSLERRVAPRSTVWLFLRTKLSYDDDNGDVDRRARESRQRLKEGPAAAAEAAAQT